ncbi:MAG: hypothetical protein OEY75_05225 [Hylemonella sp.]|nr:hypothetical protein [Hylemonella sp.]
MMHGAHTMTRTVVVDFMTSKIALLGWRARWDLAQSVRRSLDGFRRHRGGGDVRALCLSGIADFSAERAP